MSRKNRFCMSMHARLVVTGAMLAALSAWAAPETGYETGMNAIKCGNLAVAREHLGAAYKRGGAEADYAIKLAYAQVAPCSSALSIYREIANGTAPDSLKARASVRLGDHAFAGGNCALARDHYQTAVRLHSDPRYRSAWARAAACSGDDETAKSIWHTLSLELQDDIAQEARCNLAKLLMKREHYDQAYSMFLKTGKTTEDDSWSAVALIGKIDCASRLGLTDKIAAYERQLGSFKQVLLEREMLSAIMANQRIQQNAQVGGGPASGAAPDSLTKTPAIADTQKLFTLQVGAFGSLDNASKLQQKLATGFEHVTVATVSVSDQTFYRVRVGSFSTKELADSFGSDKLVKAGYTYRIVEK